MLSSLAKLLPIYLFGAQLASRAVSSLSFIVRNTSRFLCGLTQLVVHVGLYLQFRFAKFHFGASIRNAAVARLSEISVLKKQINISFYHHKNIEILKGHDFDKK